MHHWMKALLGLVFLTACCCRPAPQMTFCDYTTIEMGTPIKQVQCCWGPSYECYNCCEEDAEQYVYIERMEPRPGFEEHHRYIFTVRNGLIVEKSYEHHEAPFRFHYTPKAQPHAGEYGS